MKSFYSEEIHGLSSKDIEGNYARWVLADNSRILEVEDYFKEKGVEQKYLDLAFDRNKDNKIEPTQNYR